MQTAIVTGAGGFIGLHLTEELTGHGYRVYALCREKTPAQKKLLAGVSIFTDMDDLPPADVFYHLAWASASGPGRGDPLIQTRNAELTLNALLTAHRLGCKRFVGLGTVYERLEPQIEKSGRFGNSDFYILSKGYSHRMADHLALKFETDFVWCTICHPVGRYIKKDQMMAYVVADLLAGKSTPMGPAATPYDIVSARDVAQGLRLLGSAERLSRREYYIGSGSPRPLHQWLDETGRILGGEVFPEIGKLPGDNLRFGPDWFDISPIAAETGYRPITGFADSVAEVAKWVRETGV
ncbi:MAG: NAD(P)-dependent oxidoreductase [Oscillospiraceae bacterium]|jgi:nucleoside-diphosphate-sugar epimerase|nr:NAD(P)-dependent oxidoreductase [Oscillospiraceae bacterium]